MSELAEKLLEQALSLNEQDRAALAGALVESLQPRPDGDAEQAWSIEIERRLHELELHQVATERWTDVRQRLFRGYE